MGAGYAVIGMTSAIPLFVAGMILGGMAPWGAGVFALVSGNLVMVALAMRAGAPAD